MVLNRFYPLTKKTEWRYNNSLMFSIDTVPIDVFRLFLDVGLSFNGPGPYRNISLLYRIIVGNLCEPRRIISMIDLVLAKFPDKLNYYDLESRRTPLHYACRRTTSSIEIIEHLLSLGADWTIKDAYDKVPRDYIRDRRRLSDFDTIIELMGLR